MRKFFFLLCIVAANIILFKYVFIVNFYNTFLGDLAFSAVKTCIDYLRNYSAHLVINSFKELPGTIFFTWDTEIEYLVKILIYLILAFGLTLIIVLVILLFKKYKKKS